MDEDRGHRSPDREDPLQRLGRMLTPPAWLVQELQHRLVLFLNHVVMQEPVAQARMRKQQGHAIRAQWRDFSLQLQISPAGLFELAPEREPDLHVHVEQPSLAALLRGALKGHRPAIRIDGDVHLAGDLQWLADNLRWDVEEDLARLIGDAPAHAVGELGRSLAQALRGFAGPRAGSDDGGGGSA